MRYSNRVAALIVVAATFIGTALSAQTLTGREIMERVDARDAGTTTHALVQMVLVDRDGDRSERVIEQYGAETAEGLTRNLIIFHQPASVKDTRFLSVENADRGDDQWIYLPALQRVRRIAASEGGSSFMGTDFSYDDLTTRGLDDYDYELLRREDVSFTSGGGTVTRSAYVVKSTPRPGVDSQYRYTVQWIDPESLIPVRIEIFDDDGELLKVNTVSRLERVQGYWTIIENAMENVQDDHRTVLSIQRFEYDRELPSSLFSTNYLQTGRP